MMNRISRTIILATLALSGTASWGSQGLPNAPQLFEEPGSFLALIPLSADQVERVAACPEGVHCFRGGDDLKLTFTWYGCLDRIVKDDYKVVSTASKDYVFVTRILGLDKRSLAAFCTPRKQTVKIPVGTNKDIELRYMGHDEVVELPGEAL